MTYPCRPIAGFNVPVRTWSMESIRSDLKVVTISTWRLAPQVAVPTRTRTRTEVDDDSRADDPAEVAEVDLAGSGIPQHDGVPKGESIRERISSTVSAYGWWRTQPRACPANPGLLGKKRKGERKANANGAVFLLPMDSSL